MTCADYVDEDFRNAYYEGHTGNIEVTNIMVFNFFGEIVHAGVNFPGSWQDIKLASASGLINPKLSDEMNPPEYAILGDSAFLSDIRMENGKIVRAGKRNETREIQKSIEMAAVDLLMQHILPSERNRAKWGIRSLKAPFGRLRLPLSPSSDTIIRLLQV